MTQPQTPSLLIENQDAVRILTLNRPAAFNAFNLELKAALLAALQEAAADERVRAVVLTGAGKAFCAGQDLKEHLQLTQARDPRIATTVREFYNPAVTTILQAPKPVIAAINGAAAGAGAGLAYACDLRLMAGSASFSMAFAGVGLSADSGASYTLPRLIGQGRASALMLTGRKVGSAEALAIGLVDEVLDDDRLAARAAELAGQLAAGPTRAYGLIKQSLQVGTVSDLSTTLEFEAQAQAQLFESSDHHEAIAAFSEKRPPLFAGR